jgi:transposase
VPFKPKYKEWLTEYGLARITGLARDGRDRKTIAKKMGISLSTLGQWAEKFPQIGSALAIGCDAADRQVETALYKRAMGYEVEETKTTVIVAPDDSRTQKLEKYQRHIPPDPVSVIFWLKNRKPNVWRDKREFDIEGSIGLVKIFEDIDTLNDEEDDVDG